MIADCLSWNTPLWAVTSTFSDIMDPVTRDDNKKKGSSFVRVRSSIIDHIFEPQETGKYKNNFIILSCQHV